MTDPSIEDLMAELEAVKGELEKYKRDLEANTFEDTGPSVTVHFFPPYGYLYGGGGGNTGDHMYVSKKDFDKCVFDLKCWHRAYNDQINSLESALAHVKGESLRVVKVGEPCELFKLEYSECHLFRHITGGPAYIMDTAIKGRSSTDSGRAHWCAKLEGVTKEWAQYDDYAPIQPVRLERWEGSNESD